MQFVWLMLSKQFKSSRRHCGFCVNFERFHQDHFSASCWEVSSNQVIAYGLWRCCQFVIFYIVQHWGNISCSILSFSPSLFLERGDTVQKDQCILTFLLCFYAKISHIRENSLLAWFPSQWEVVTGGGDFPSNCFMKTSCVRSCGRIQ